MDRKKEMIQQIQQDFIDVGPILSAVGDETRQNIIVALLNTDPSEGMRVGELQKLTNLSKPAISHQIKMLKDLGLVKCRTEGTKNFYYIDAQNNRDMFNKLKKLTVDINVFMDLIKK